MPGAPGAAGYVQPADYLRLASTQTIDGGGAAAPQLVRDPAQVRLAYMLLAAVGA
jgi:hypothetical protein